MSEFSDSSKFISKALVPLNTGKYPSLTYPLFQSGLYMEEKAHSCLMVKCDHNIGAQ